MDTETIEVTEEAKPKKGKAADPALPAEAKELFEAIADKLDDDHFAVIHGAGPQTPDPYPVSVMPKVTLNRMTQEKTDQFAIWMSKVADRINPGAVALITSKGQIKPGSSEWKKGEEMAALKHKRRNARRIAQADRDDLLLKIYDKLLGE